MCWGSGAFVEPSFGPHILEQMLRVNLCEAMRGIFLAKNGFPRWSWGQLGTVGA